MRLIWKNAMTYNRPDSDIFETAEKLAKLFEKKIAKIKSNKKARTEGAAEGDKEANREVTRADRLKFSSMVSSLTSEQLGSLVQMIQKECPEAINDVSENSGPSGAVGHACASNSLRADAWRVTGLSFFEAFSCQPACHSSRAL